MHVKAKTMAFGGLLLALAVVCMALGSIIETSTLFLLAAASFFVGIVIREFGLKIGAAFYIAAVLLGFITAPNKFYVLTFAAMGLYIWGIEAVFRWLEKHPKAGNRRTVFWISKYVIFNVMYIPIVLIFRNMLFARSISGLVIAGVIIGGQAALFIYDRAYEYVQTHVWGRIRGRVLS
ncbi:hypothetical protein H6A65_01380 [Mediterraneibacter glycyrrhizinilyticus]|uniref:hypothetical protein n=1 Tax=Mediterraneibacter glycyrrhizinilyticus TaxID=342942 RepID=UPI001961F96C|nr:hypothetical protein [Mediterraneibacter glycyrrhizinilyticus]MBM6750156.1 hypothetical protein [Mediterraneibacter glycyrrhizinilyticus]